MPPSDEQRWENDGGTIPISDRAFTRTEQAAYDRGVRRGYHQCLEDIEEMLRRQHRMVRQIQERVEVQD